MSGLAIGAGHHLNKGIAAVIFIFFATILVVIFSGNTGPDFIADIFTKKPIYIGNATFRVWVAQTDSERMAGLSDKYEMSGKGGMLFVFESDGLYGVSTADMHFPIDIVWLSKEGLVVYAETDVRPGREYPVGPTAPARYVLLVNAGTVDEYHIDAETHVNLSNVR